MKVSTKRPFRLPLLAACALVIAAALGAQPSRATSQPPPPTAAWPRSEPETQGLDAARLARLTETLRQSRTYPDLHSLLIVRNGYLVVEEYFDGWSAERLHALQSVTKSFTSALVGIAIEQGVFRGVDERVLDFYADVDGIEHLDDRKRVLTIEDLLTMRSGTDYHERGGNSPHDQLNRLPRGWDRFYLDRPMARAPGTVFQYDSGGVILLSSLLERRTGLHADAFAARYLFEPLGITEWRWFRNQEGHPHTGGGLSLRPRDMAKLGLLYLREGRWGDRQVVPASWVRTSTTRHVDLSGRREVAYGYLWWIHRPDPDGRGRQDIYAAEGFRGQYIFVVPEHDMVVVVTAGTSRYSDEVRPIDLLYEEILPSVERQVR